MIRFVIRLDDICATMNWSKFWTLHELFMRTGVKPLLGVVPHNEDPELVVDAPNECFWPLIRGLAEQGWVIAQHGYRHVYATQHAGLLNVNARSEFAGLAYEEQRCALEKGKTILQENGLDTDIFMAPSHSFDMNTIRSLVDLRFNYVTDGYGLYPYQLGGLTFVPQLISKPLHIGFGVYTMCLHLNQMSEGEMLRITRFVRGHKNRIASFREVSCMMSNRPLTNISYHATRVLLQGTRLLRRKFGQ